MADSADHTLDPRSVAAIFDDWAERGRAEGMERGHEHAARAGFDRLRVGTSTRYLDVGCGNGYSVRWAAAVSPDVRAVGIDVSSQMIDRARTQSVDFTNCEYYCGEFPEVAVENLGPISFDAVFSMEVFYYLPDLSGALSAVSELLAPHGRFACVVDHYAENIASHGWGAEMGLPLHLLSADEWRAMFEAAGFKSVEQHRIRATPVAGEPDTWKQIEGSLMTLGQL